jgi:hypothetical protein
LLDQLSRLSVAPPLSTMRPSPTWHERLAAEASYDPDNLFHVNQNIAPAN